MKQILLISYTFPPNQGIASRRWAKLAKGLAKKGYTIHVVKAEPPENNKESFWSKDVANDNIRIYSLPRNYPTVLEKPKPGVFGKLQYRWHKKLLEFKTKGTIYDLAFAWKDVLFPLAERLIQKYKIDTVIGTGAPFSVPYYVAKMKERYSVKTIVDYRDPYIDADNYGMPYLSSERKQHEVSKHRYIIEHVDFLTSPYESMQMDLIKTSETQKNIENLIELEHFYDFEEIAPLLKPEELETGKIKFVYGGELYLGLDHYLHGLNKALTALKQKTYYNKLQFDFYVNDINKRTIFEENSEIVNFYPQTPDILKKIATSNFVLIFYSEHKKHHRTTKFMEFLPFKKPYIYLGPEGFVSEFIEAENLGISLSKDPMKLESVLAEYQNNTISFNKDFDHTQFSLDAICDKLINLIES
ncbi:MAG: hypothetical protein MRY83_09300 [Flavobacteriales bacterium]|nr:hypothetical protein [Flavobacteriales bacterium]